MQNCLILIFTCSSHAVMDEQTKHKYIVCCASTFTKFHTRTVKVKALAGIKYSYSHKSVFRYQQKNSNGLVSNIIGVFSLYPLMSDKKQKSKLDFKSVCRSMGLSLKIMEKGVNLVRR